MSPPIRKAILPVAGLGTRFLPITKTIPKEMLPILTRPVIDYVVEEAQEAGITQFIFVTGRNKETIENYFDHAYETEDILRKNNKTELYEKTALSRLPPGAAVFIRQQQPRGLGHAILCAREVIGEEPFAVLLPDVIMGGRPNCLEHLVALYQSRPDACYLSVQEVSREQTEKYGIIKSFSYQNSPLRVMEMIEKPLPSAAPSLYAITGRYILSPRIFTILAALPPGANGEIQLTDAMNSLCATYPFYASVFAGRCFDCGTPSGWLEANIAFGENKAF